MKLWTMPRIVVESFTPNDSIAMCNESKSVKPKDLNGATLYWDYKRSLVGYGTWDSGETISIKNGNEFDPPDGFANNDESQLIKFYTGFTWIPFVYDNDTAESYRVWIISDTRAYIYEVDAYPEIAPTERVNWS